jgi:hypothetical protein
MATSTKLDFQIPDPISALATANESAAQTVPLRANWMDISSDVVVHLRLKTGENGFRIPANEIYRWDVASLAGQTFFIRNDSGSNANVSFLVQTFNTP